MLILPHKSRVRYRLNIIFNRARPNQTCENKEQREIQNSRIGSDVGLTANQGVWNSADSSESAARRHAEHWG